MTKEDIIKFYEENRQQNDLLNELGQEILEAVRLVYLSQVLIEDPDSDPDPNVEVISLYNSTLETIRLNKEICYDQIGIWTTRGKYFFFVEDLVAPDEEIGENIISWKIKHLEEDMDKLMLQLGKVQEAADKINQKWHDKKKQLLERKTR